jgi:dTDP-4-amino-4,6-dideoxygalactose transaminase
MIDWVPKKNINIDNINNKIFECLENKNFTNNGKNVIELQKNIKNIFKIENTKEILLTCNGSMGLNALVSGFNIYFNKKLKWIVQSFTFPSSVQGNLIESKIFDIDENMGPDINLLIKNKNDYDGIIITNCFGTSVNIELYENFCTKNNKILIFDNAASCFTTYKNKNHLNYGNGCIVSLHHTKPIGFGEGGFIIFDKNYLESMEKAICFGYTKSNKYEYNIYANNYKMSEIACIYINEYLQNMNNIYNHHISLIKYFIDKMKKYNLKIKLIKNFSKYDESLMSCIPILFENKIGTDIFIENKIEAKKYYFPLDSSCTISNKLFENIICLPLNIDIDENIVDYYINIIKKILLLNNK